MQFEDGGDVHVGAGEGEDGGRVTVDELTRSGYESNKIIKGCLSVHAYGGMLVLHTDYLAVFQMSTLWHQCKCDASYAPWTRGTENFMQCLWYSMGKGKSAKSY